MLWLVFLGAVILSLVACQKKAPAPVPTVRSRPNCIRLADQQFDAADYATAAQSYERCLRESNLAGERERALFRLALACAIPESPVRDLPKAVQYFEQLLKAAPQGEYRPQLQLILGLYAELEKIRAENRLQEQQLKALNSELAKLKKIDMQKRPVRPPD
jgi:outer membrane protein assembly factor BamD (BamD/ComL family)